MSTVKRILAIVLAMSLVFGLAACSSNSGSQTPEPGTPDTEPEKEVITLKVAGSGIDNYTDYMMKQFKKYVEERSDGAILVDYYPNLQLGSIREYFEAVQHGQIQIGEGGAVILSNFTDKYSFLQLPYLFDSKEAVQLFVHSQEGQDLIQEIADETNLYLLALAQAGYFAVANSKHPITQPSDLKGLKVRTQESPMIIKYFETQGASPTPMAYSELFTALQQGTVDGHCNPVPAMATTNMWEVQKYVTDVDFIYDMIAVAIDYNYFKSLDEETQKFIQDCMNDAWADELEWFNQKDWFGVLAENGMEVYRLSPEEKQAFKDAAQPVYDWFREQGTEPNLDKYLEAIDRCNKEAAK